MRRRPAGKGLSYFDANSGRLITEGPDVLEVKKEIESRWPNVISCFFDVEAEEWVIVEHCSDGTDRVAITTKYLTFSIVEKLQKMDQATHDLGDLNRGYERQEDQAEKDKDHQLSESLGEPLERFYHALRKDYIINRPQVFVPKDVT